MDFEFDNMPLGSIFISVDYVEEKAKEYGHTLMKSLRETFIHGLLHLLGFEP